MILRGCVDYPGCKLRSLEVFGQWCEGCSGMQNWRWWSWNCIIRHRHWNHPIIAQQNWWSTVNVSSSQRTYNVWTFSLPVVSILTSGGEHPHFRWCTSSLPVVNIITSGGEHIHFRWWSSSLPVVNILTSGDAHHHFRWWTSSLPVGNILTSGGEHLHFRFGSVPYQLQRTGRLTKIAVWGDWSSILIPFLRSMMTVMQLDVVFPSLVEDRRPGEDQGFFPSWTRCCCRHQLITAEFRVFQECSMCKIVTSKPVYSAGNLNRR